MGQVLQVGSIQDHPLCRKQIHVALVGQADDIVLITYMPDSIKGRTVNRHEGRALGNVRVMSNQHVEMNMSRTDDDVDDM